MRVVLRHHRPYLFDEVLCFLAFLFKISYFFDVYPTEDSRYACARLGNVILVVQVGFAVNLLLEAVNDGLVAVGGFLKD